MTHLITFTITIRAEYRGIEIEEKSFTVSTPVDPSLIAAQNAEAAVAAGIAKYITDVATALKNAIGQPGGVSPADVQAIADKLTADATTLTTADTSITPPVTP